MRATVMADDDNTGFFSGNNHQASHTFSLNDMEMTRMSYLFWLYICCLKVIVAPRPANNLQSSIFVSREVNNIPRQIKMSEDTLILAASDRWKFYEFLIRQLSNWRARFCKLLDEIGSIGGKEYFWRRAK